MKKLKTGASDDNGRLRLHGAFTGGYSAGYFNTVGTVEGFKPSTFVSSRSQRSNVIKKSVKDYMEESDDSSDDEDRKVDELAEKSGYFETNEVVPRHVPDDAPIERSLLLDAKSAKTSRVRSKHESSSVYRVDDIHYVGLAPESIPSEPSDSRTKQVIFSKPTYSIEEELDFVYENARDNDKNQYRRLADDTVIHWDGDSEVKSLGSNRFKESVLSRINDNIDGWLDKEEQATVEVDTVNRKVELPNTGASVNSFVRPQLKSVLGSGESHTADDADTEGTAASGSIFDMMAPHSKARLQYFLEHRNNRSQQTDGSDENKHAASVPTSESINSSISSSISSSSRSIEPSNRPMLVSKYQSSLASFVALNESFKNRFTSSTSATPALTEAVPKEGITTAAELQVERQKAANESATFQLLESLNNGNAGSAATVSGTAVTATTKLINKRTTVLWPPHSLLCKRMNIKPPEAVVLNSSGLTNSKTDERIDSMLGLIQKTEDTSYTVLTTDTDRKYKLQQQQTASNQSQANDANISIGSTEAAAPQSALTSIEIKGEAVTSHKLSRMEKKKLHDAKKAATLTTATVTTSTAATEAAEALPEAPFESVMDEESHAENVIVEPTFLRAASSIAVAGSSSNDGGDTGVVTFLSRSERVKRSLAGLSVFSSTDAKKTDAKGATIVSAVPHSFNRSGDSEEDDSDDPLRDTSRRRKRVSGSTASKKNTDNNVSSRRRLLPAIARTVVPEDSPPFPSGTAAPFLLFDEETTEAVKQANVVRKKVHEEGHTEEVVLLDDNQTTAEAFLLTLATEEQQEQPSAIKTVDDHESSAPVSEIERLIANYNNSIKQYRGGGGATAGSSSTTSNLGGSVTAASITDNERGSLTEFFRSVPWDASRNNATNIKGAKDEERHRSSLLPEKAEKRAFDSVVQKLQSQLHRSSEEEDSSEESDSTIGHKDKKRKKSHKKEHKEHHKKHSSSKKKKAKKSSK